MAALAVATVLAAGSSSQAGVARTQALLLSANPTHAVIPPGSFADAFYAEVTFQLNEERENVGLHRCSNGRIVDSGSEITCRGLPTQPRQFGRRARTATDLLSTGRHEFVAVDGHERSNVVVVVVEDECGWVGTSGPPPDASFLPVLPGAPYPCMTYLNGNFALRSEGGGTLTHSGNSYMTPGAVELRVLPSGNRLRLAPAITMRLGYERPYAPARLRYAARGRLARFWFVTETQAGNVYTRGQAEVEISHRGLLPRPARRPTRVRVYRGQAVFVPFVTGRGIRLAPGCARATIACLSKARAGKRRAALVRAGQTRTFR